MCDCVAEFNKVLEPRNGRIAMAIQVTEDLDLKARICIATEKIDPKKRKPIPVVSASFCPFCGEKVVL